MKITHRGTISFNKTVGQSKMVILKQFYGCYLIILILYNSVDFISTNSTTTLTTKSSTKASVFLPNNTTLISKSSMTEISTKPSTNSTISTDAKSSTSNPTSTQNVMSAGRISTSPTVYLSTSILTTKSPTNSTTLTLSTFTESQTNSTASTLSKTTESPTNPTTSTLSTSTESPTSSTTSKLSTLTDNTTSLTTSTLVTSAESLTSLTTSTVSTSTESPTSSTTSKLSTLTDNTTSSTISTLVTSAESLTSLTTSTVSTSTESPTSSTKSTVSTSTEIQTSLAIATAGSTTTTERSTSSTPKTVSTSPESLTSLTTTELLTDNPSISSNATTSLKTVTSEERSTLYSSPADLNTTSTAFVTTTEETTIITANYETNVIENDTTLNMPTTRTTTILPSTRASTTVLPPSTIEETTTITTNHQTNTSENDTPPNKNSTESTRALPFTSVSTSVLPPSTTEINTITEETTTTTTTDYETDTTENDTTSNTTSTEPTPPLPVTLASTTVLPPSTTETQLQQKGPFYSSKPFRDGINSYLEVVVLASMNTTVNFVWYLNGIVVNKGVSSLRVYAVDNRNETTFTSTLVFHPISYRDNGHGIRYEVNSYRYPSDANETLSLLVLPQPSLDVFPRSPSIQNGSLTNITCNITNYEKINASKLIQWLLNNKNYSGVSRISTGTGWKANIIEVSVEGNYTCLTSKDCISCANYSIVSVYEKEIVPCESTDEWPTTAPGSIQVKPCPNGFSGEMSRKCEKLDNGSGKWKDVNRFKCIRKDIQDIFESVTDVAGKNVTNVLEDSLGKINNFTENSTSLSSGELYKTVDILDQIINLGNVTNTTVDKEVFGDIIGNLISDSADNRKKWNEVNQEGGASRILKTVTAFGKVAGKVLENGKKINVTKENMVLQIEKSSPKKIDFKQGISELEFPKENLKPGKEIVIITAYFETIGSILPSSKNNKSFVASPVMSLTIDGFENQKLKEPLELTLLNRNVNKTERKTDCVFWNFTEGKWSSNGCTYKQSKSNTTVSFCECTHLTNFAILMSQGDESISEEDRKRLQIISDIGCSLSILGLILTMVVYARVWRYVKNERSILLMNLCVALTIAYILFLAAVDRDVGEIPCTIITACLHYIFLVVFFIMFAEGIDIFIAVVIVFRTKSKMKFLLMMSWGVPLIIAGLTVGLTRDKEYFTPQYCWLTIRGGVLFAFVGPIAFIILANILVIIITLRAVYSTHSMKSKKTKEKALSGIRSICTLLPILGITWLFGLLTVNNDSAVFQYLFALTNSFQGFFIFIFHCVLNRAVQKGMRHIVQRHDLYKSRTKESLLKLQRTKSSESTETQNKNSEKVLHRDFSEDSFALNRFQMPRIPLTRPQKRTSGFYLNASYEENCEENF